MSEVICVDDLRRDIDDNFCRQSALWYRRCKTHGLSSCKLLLATVVQVRPYLRKYSYYKMHLDRGKRFPLLVVKPRGLVPRERALPPPLVPVTFLVFLTRAPGESSPSPDPEAPGRIRDRRGTSVSPLTGLALWKRHGRWIAYECSLVLSAVRRSWRRSEVRTYSTDILALRVPKISTYVGHHGHVVKEQPQLIEALRKYLRTDLPPTPPLYTAVLTSAGYCTLQGYWQCSK